MGQGHSKVKFKGISCHWKDLLVKIDVVTGTINSSFSFKQSS